MNRRARSLVVFASLVLAAGTWSSAQEATQSATLEAATGTDLILVIDTSKSMRGVGGTADIFGDVKGACKDLVKELARGDTVTLIPYDSDVRAQPTVTLVSETERIRLFHQVDALQAEGNWTFTSRALQEGLTEAGRLEESLPGHQKVVVILTDGINEPPQEFSGKGPALEEVALPYQGKPWYVFQVQLGQKVDPELERAVATFRNGRTIHDPQGAHLDELAKRVKPAPPKELEWSVKPREVSLTLKKLGVPMSADLGVEFPGDVSPDGLSAKLDASALPEGVTVQWKVVARPEGGAVIRLTARAENEVPNGTVGTTLFVSLAAPAKAYRVSPIEVSVVIRTAMVPPVWPYWLGGFLALILVVIVAFWLRRQHVARILFGQIEAWPKDHPEQMARFRDLSLLGTKANIGGGGISLPGVSSTLGTLATISVDGEQHVVVRPAGEERLRFSSRTQVELPLYNGDEFEIGDWVFRYRGAVSRRRNRQ